MPMANRWVRTMVAAAAALGLACSPLRQPENSPQMPTSGWYTQQGARASFQPCGEETLEVVDGADLRRRARDFGLQDGDPVYVRLLGTRAGSQFQFDRVSQFGSPLPVRDCTMTGTSLQSVGEGID